jgi:hypothetical protein
VNYPTDLAGRIARRELTRARLVANAEAQAYINVRSIVCGWYDQHDTCSGAVNCLCECHDPREGE